MYNFELSPNDAHKILMACTSIGIGFNREINDPNTSDERKEIAQRSKEMWKRLHDEIKAQMVAQDEAEDEALARMEEMQAAGERAADEVYCGYFD